MDADKYNRSTMKKDSEENRLEDIQLENFKERRGASVQKVHSRLEKIRTLKARK